MKTKTIAIFGGTFDPVHNGHLLTSLAIQNYFHFDTYLFLPCKIPLLKNPAQASNQQRIEMLDIAIRKHPNFTLDLREINRDSPSYMVDTLTSIRIENQTNSISLIIGYDAFISLPIWYQWEKIIKLANLVVINREYFSKDPIPETLIKLVKTYNTKNKKQIITEPYGHIYFFDAGNYEISSTEIRKDLKTNDSRLPKEVYEYINLQGLYQ